MRSSIFVAAFLSLSLAPLAVACSTSATNDAADLAIADVNYEGDANDEALLALLSGTVDTAMKIPVTNPAPNAVLPVAPAPVFAWGEPVTAFNHRPASKAFALGFAPSRETSLQPLKAGRPNSTLLSLFEGTAYAHGDPINGYGYLLVFKAGGQRIGRVFTTKTTYVPSADLWAAVRTAKGATLQITGATFEANLVVDKAGPFVSPEVTFTVTP